MMEEEKWTLVIVPKTGFFKLDLGELWRYRDLLVKKYGTKEDVFPTLFQQEKCQKCLNEGGKC